MCLCVHLAASIGSCHQERGTHTQTLVADHGKAVDVNLCVCLRVCACACVFVCAFGRLYRVLPPRKGNTLKQLVADHRKAVTSTCVCACVCVCVCVCVCASVCVCVCVYVCVGVGGCVCEQACVVKCETKKLAASYSAVRAFPRKRRSAHHC